MAVTPAFLLSCWRQNFREQTRDSSSPVCTALDENKLCSPSEINGNSELRAARTVGQQGDRQVAKGSCLDDKGRKNKM